MPGVLLASLLGTLALGKHSCVSLTVHVEADRAGWWKNHKVVFHAERKTNMLASLTVLCSSICISEGVVTSAPELVRRVQVLACLAVQGSARLVLFSKKLTGGGIVTVGCVSGPLDTLPGWLGRLHGTRVE